MNGERFTVSGWNRSSSTWLLTDHLNSTSITANEDGSLASEIRYRATSPQRSEGDTAFGEVRTANGVTVTDNRYTGQRQEMEIGLYYYVARWYDPVIAHFLQADSIVPEPGSLLALDRYAYTLYNPIKYTDPSGHKVDQGGGASSMNDYDKNWWLRRNYNLNRAKAKPQTPTISRPSISSLPVIGPSKPPATEKSNQPQASGEKSIMPILEFADKVVSPFSDLIDAEDTYRTLSKGGWKAVSYTFPFGPVEGIVAAVRQINHDNQIPNLTLAQRSARAVTLGLEAYAIDYVSNLAGTAAAAGFGVATVNPGTAAVSYFGSAALLSSAGEKFCSNVVNPWIFNSALPWVGFDPGYYPYHGD